MNHFPREFFPEPFLASGISSTVFRGHFLEESIEPLWPVTLLLQGVKETISLVPGPRPFGMTIL